MRLRFVFSGEQLLQLLLTAALVCFLIPAFFLSGPWLEQTLFPVLTVKMTAPSEVGGRLKFYLTGTKHRSCQLAVATFGWRYGTAAMPTNVADEAGQPTAIGGFIQGGQTFVLGPFFALVPAAVRLAAEPDLTVTWYYRCHALWLTEHDLVVPVKLAPPPALPLVQQQGGTP